jgi:hypothetical protein
MARRDNTRWRYGEKPLATVSSKKSRCFKGLGGLPAIGRWPHAHWLGCMLARIQPVGRGSSLKRWPMSSALAVAQRVSIRTLRHARHPFGLLRARRVRPHHRRAAEERDEIAPSQLIEEHSVPSQAGAGLQDIELARISQEVSERIYNLPSVGESATPFMSRQRGAFSVTR